MCIRSSLHSVRFGHLLRCAHKRVDNIILLYSESNNDDIYIYIYVCVGGIRQHCARVCVSRMTST